MGYDVVNLSSSSSPAHAPTNTRNNYVPELIVVNVENDKKPEKYGKWNSKLLGVKFDVSYDNKKVKKLI